MRRVPHSWRKAYELALMESDLIEMIGCIEYAMNTLERRYSEWGTDPGTPAELSAIQKCISALARLMKQSRPATEGANLPTSAGRSSGTGPIVTESQGHGTEYSRFGVA